MESSQDEMSFLDHLEALRWHLIRAIIAVLAVGVVAFVCKDFIFQIIFAPKNGDFFTYRMFCKIGHLFGFESAFCAEQLPFTIQSRTMAGQFSAHIWTSIWAGVILAFPYVLYEVWKFISPALYENERKLARGFILFAVFYRSFVWLLSHHPTISEFLRVLFSKSRSEKPNRFKLLYFGSTLVSHFVWHYF